MAWRPPPAVHTPSADSFTVRRADLFSIDSSILTQPSSSRDLFPPISHHTSIRSQSRSPNPATRTVSPSSDRQLSRGGGRSRAYTTTGLPQPPMKQQPAFFDNIAMNGTDTRPATTLTVTRRPHTLSQPPAVDPSRRARTAQTLELPPLASETRPHTPRGSAFPLSPVSTYNSMHTYVM